MFKRSIVLIPLDSSISPRQQLKEMTSIEHTRMSSSSSGDESLKINPEKPVKASSASTPADSSSTTSNSAADTAAVAASPTTATENLEVTSRFAGAGVDFKGKLIGIEEVSEPRGDKMCQVAMAKLKAGVKAAGDHKQRITINVSLEGIKIIDEKTTEIVHTHEVSKISFIARDTGDSRAFGYVYKRKEGSHQFFGIKTEKAAEGVVLSLKELFQTVFEIRKRKSAETNNNNAEPETTAAGEKNGTEQKSDDAKPPAETGGTSLLDLMDVLPTLTVNDAQPIGGLSPSLRMLDPWASSALPPTGTPQMPQVQPFGSPFYSQPSSTSVFVMPNFQSPGAALFGTSNANASTTVPTAAPQVFPAAVVWPSPMMTAPAMPSTGLQMGASFPARLDNSAVPTPAANDPFAALAQPSQPPLIPARRISPNNPFTGAPTARPDPFADFTVLSAAAAGGGTVQPHQPGKKTDKKDFFQEPPKPSLFDLSQQQQKQIQQQQLQQTPALAPEPVKDLFGSTPFSSLTAANDPFA